MATRKTGTFALVIPEAEVRVFSEDAFFTRAITGAREELAREGKQLVLMLAPERRSYDRIERFITDGHVDGVLIASLHGVESLPKTLSAAGVPLVAIVTPPGEQGIPYVDVDHRKAVFEAVNYLLAAGRSNVVTIAGPQDMFEGVERLRGYEAAMEEAGEKPVVGYGDFTRESGAQAMHDFIIDGVPVDAVFAASDLMALGAMSLLQKGGLRVPEDVAIIGFDDIRAALHADPPLTTIRQPVHEYGTTAARQVMRLAAGEDVEDSVMLPTEFIVRQSA